MHEYFLAAPGPRPPFRLVAEHLWGAGCDFDSDGDSVPFDANDWTELTIALRPELEARVDVDPLEDAEPLILWVRSRNESLARRAAEFLAEWCGGRLLRDRPSSRVGE